MSILGVDVGGTFTDAVLVEDGRISTAKVPTAARQEESVLAAARAVGARDLERFTHGTTVATNALLERKGAKTAFVATAGFEHLLHLRRQARAHLYRLCDDHPEPLVPLDRCFGVDERVGPDGVLRPLDLESLPEIDAEAVAVCCLFRSETRSTKRPWPRSFEGDCPERASSPRTRSRRSSASTSAPRRLRSTPTSAHRWRAIWRRSRIAAPRTGLPEPLVMRSSGGVATIAEAAAHPAFALLSGPAAGAVGAALAARAAGVEDAVSLDMGGTSTDVALIRNGEVERGVERSVAGFPVRLPSVDIQTVGAGGGSIAWLDEGGALRVGPESAGADPGPACYGRGGTRPTVTDANLVLGRLPDTLASGLRLDRAAAERALGDLDPEAVVRAVNAEMVRAVRLVSVERGHDPRGLSLVAFGGAGPLHACELADELELHSVLVPESAGVLSALGLAASDERRDVVRSYLVPLDEAGELPRAGEADLRYAGQSFELTVPLGPGLAQAFHRAHEERYGYADRSRQIELVAVRTAEIRPGPAIERGTTPGARMVGPAMLELDTATCWLPPGWVGVRDGKGAGWRLTRS